MSLTKQYIKPFKVSVSVKIRSLITRATITMSLFIVCSSLQANDYFLFDMPLENLLDMRVMSASKTPDTYSRLTTTVDLITHSDIKKSGARNIYDVIGLLPGIHVALLEEGERQLTFRGANSIGTPGILIMLNGHVLNGLRTGSAANQRLDELPVDNIKLIEVVKGPASALYGANAYLGVINVVTFNGGEKNGTEISVSGLGDDDKYLGESLNLSWRSSNRGHDISMNGYYENYKGHNVWVAQDNSGQSGYGNFEHEIWDFQLRYKNKHINSQLRSFSRESGGAYGFNSVLSDVTRLKTQGGFAEVKVNFDLSEAFQYEHTLYVDHIDMDDFVSPDTFGVVTAEIPVKETIYGTNLDGFYKGINNHALTIGGAYRKESLHDPRFFTNIFNPNAPPRDYSDTLNWIDEASREIYSFYVEDVWKPNDSTNVVAGIRFDDYSDFGATTNPRIGINREINNNFTIRASYGQAFRAPDFGNQFIKNNPFVLGNPELEPEEIDAFEIALQEKHNGNQWGYVAVFFNVLNNLIDVPVGERQFQNVGEAKVRGLELVSNWEVERLKLRVFYSYTEAELNNRAFPDVADHMVGFVTDFAFSHNVHWNLNVFSQSDAAREYRDEREDSASYQLSNTTLLFKDCLIKNLDFRLSIYNLFDEQYSYPSRYGEVPGDLPAQKRNYALKFDYRM